MEGSMEGTMAELPDTLRRALPGMGLAGDGERLAGEPLTGGVASDIWRVELGDERQVCVKRALAQLRVAGEWRVSTRRNAYEVTWLELAAEIVPGAVPRVLGHDPEEGVFAMEYFPPQSHPNWKAQLRDGTVRQATAIAVADRLARIHGATADRPELAGRFDGGELFRDLRLVPYLHATARVHTDLAGPLEALSDMVESHRRVLVHGDVSPKNILVGPAGPVLLDAECACISDPAFDLAFCLNHLLLKCLWVPAARRNYLAAFEGLAGHYLAAVTWEDPAAVERRAARLLPGLLLARVDGTSPVEYLEDEWQRDCVRHFARRFLLRPGDRLAELATAWGEALAARDNSHGGSHRGSHGEHQEQQGTTRNSKA